MTFTCQGETHSSIDQIRTQSLNQWFTVHDMYHFILEENWGKWSWMSQEGRNEKEGFQPIPSCVIITLSHANMQS